MAISRKMLIEILKEKEEKVLGQINFKNTSLTQ